MVLLALAATPVLASVTFDLNTGKGFVGKGDIQDGFGWNNAQLQNNASGVTFTYIGTSEYLVTEAWATGNTLQPWSLSSHVAEISTVAGVAVALDGSPRQVKGQKQFTGFNLDGISSSVIVGDVPEADYIDWSNIFYDRQIGKTWYYGLETERLPFDENGNLYIAGNHKAVVSVELISSTDGLFANYGGASVQIWSPVVPTP